jgi:hypothetical protein
MMAINAIKATITGARLAFLTPAYGRTCFLDCAQVDQEERDSALFLLYPKSAACAAGVAVLGVMSERIDAARFRTARSVG